MHTAFVDLPVFGAAMTDDKKSWTSLASPGPPVLQGVKVVELATVIAAPSASAVLADFGATVIKVERLGVGDTWRLDRANLTPDSAWGGGPHFANNNRGKRSVALDVKDPVHLEALKTLIRSADVFVTNVRSGALDRAGLGYPQLSKECPRLVYAILSAWGLDGPRVNDPGYDVGAFWAASGMQDFTKQSDDTTPGNFPPGFGDHLTAMQLVAAIALALYHRLRTGAGQLVDTALLRSGIWGMAYPALNTACAPGRRFVREPRTEHYRPSFNCYRCSDGLWLQLLGLDWQRFLRPLCRALQLPHAEANDLHIGPGWALPKAELDACGGDERERQRRTIAKFEAAFATRPSAYWEAALSKEGVWYQKVAALDEVLDEPQAQAALAKVDWAPFPIVRCPFQLGCSTAHGPAGPPPKAGAHTAAALREVGVSDAAIGKIVADQQSAQRKLTSKL